MTFKESGLRKEIVSATIEMGFERATAIQEKVIPLILNTASDIIALAQTGTGKTAAFGLPLIQMTEIQSRHIQTIVLCPTRELCIQITSDMEKYAKHVESFKTVAVYGGADIRKQIREIKDGCQVVVGTPGRVLDMIKRRALQLAQIRWVVLDEADEMLNMGFKEDLDTILAETPQGKRTLLFSATMAGDVAKIAKKYMHKPEEVSVGNRNQGAENVRHEYYIVQARDRYAALKRIADIYPNIYGIIFCRTRQITKDIAQKLMTDGYNSDTLHGDLSQSQRDHVMNRFRQKQLQLLVATDVAARGLDVNDLTHIINFDLPDDNEVYIHRTGRTARAGKSGVAISIIHTRELNKIKSIERMVGKKFTARPVPTGNEICEKQLFNLVDRMEKVDVDEEQISQFMPVIYKKLEWLDREELIKHFVSIEFNRFLAYYKNTPDLNAESPENHKGRKNNGSLSFVPLRINLGRNSGLNPSQLIAIVNEQTHKRNIPIGRIKIGSNSSMFEVGENYKNEIIKAFRKASYNGFNFKVDAETSDLRHLNKYKKR